MKKTVEPFLWSLFGAGGTLAAFFLPVFIFLTGIAFPLGWVSAPAHDRLWSMVENPIVRIGLWAIISLSLFHWAHRFRFTLYDGLQLKHLYELIAVLTYGTAILGTLVAGYVLMFLSST